MSAFSVKLSKMQSKSKLKHLLYQTPSSCFLVLAFAQPYRSCWQSTKESTRKINIFILIIQLQYGCYVSKKCIAESCSERTTYCNGFLRPINFSCWPMILNHSINEHWRIFIETDPGSIRSISNSLLSDTHVNIDVFNLKRRWAIILSTFFRISKDGQLKLESLSTDSSMTINFIPLQSVHQQNLYVDILVFWIIPFIQPNASNELIVRIKK